VHKRPSKIAHSNECPLRQLWYAKSRSESSRVVLSLQRFDKSECIKEPRLRRGSRCGKGIGVGEKKKKRPACLMKLSFQRGLYATPLPYSISLRHTASDLTISYSSTPLEKLVKFASDTIVRLSRASCDDPVLGWTSSTTRFLLFLFTKVHAIA